MDLYEYLSMRNTPIICKRDRYVAFLQVGNEKAPKRLRRWHFTIGKEYSIGSVAVCYDKSFGSSRSYYWKCDIIDDKNEFIIFRCDDIFKYFDIISIADRRRDKLKKLNSYGSV